MSNAPNILFTISNLILNEVIETNAFHISNDKNKLNEILTNERRQYLGLLTSNSINNEPSFVYSVINASNKNGYKRALNYIGHVLRHYLQFLWFVRDNSVSVTESFTFTKRDGVISQTHNTVFTNASGEFKPEKFTKSEFEFAAKLMRIHTEICKIKNVVVDETLLLEDPDDEKKNIMLRGNGKIYNHNDFSRIERAILFLEGARAISYLPQKIAFYIPIIESLFCAGESQEVSFKTCLRASSYLGGDTDIRLSNFDILKDAYTIRSRFFHGDQLEKKHNPHDRLVEISNQTDNVVRQILTKVFLNDISIFQQNQNELSQFYRTLTFA